MLSRHANTNAHMIQGSFENVKAKYKVIKLFFITYTEKMKRKQETLESFYD